MAVLLAGMLLLNVATASEDDLAALAAEAGVDVVDLAGAADTTGMDPREYLYMTGELKKPVPEPVYGVWDRLAQCESSGNWHINAYHDGGLQFLPSTWNAYKLPGYPAFAYQASRAQQIAVGQRVLAAQGWKAWPVCSRRLGLR
jgi:hypothetical protein